MADVIFKRASVRRFTDDPMTDDEVRALLRAGMAAPSGGNQQPWEFYVVRDRATLQLLSEASPYAKPAAGAACAIVPCMRTEGLRFPEIAVQDMGACVENILLEAVDLGFGAVWMGIAPSRSAWPPCPRSWARRRGWSRLPSSRWAIRSPSHAPRARTAMPRTVCTG